VDTGQHGDVTKPSTLKENSVLDDEEDELATDDDETHGVKLLNEPVDDLDTKPDDLIKEVKVKGGCTYGAR